MEGWGWWGWAVEKGQVQHLNRVSLHLQRSWETMRSSLNESEDPCVDKQVGRQGKVGGTQLIPSPCLCAPCNSPVHEFLVLMGRWSPGTVEYFWSSVWRQAGRHPPPPLESRKPGFSFLLQSPSWTRGRACHLFELGCHLLHLEGRATGSFCASAFRAREPGKQKEGTAVGDGILRSRESEEECWWGGVQGFLRFKNS